MTIYTKKGDLGKTSVFGMKKQISKSSQIIKTLGAIDEANSYLGIVRSIRRINKTTKKDIEKVQKDLIIVGSIIAGAKIKWKTERVKELEEEINGMEKKLPKLTNFILSGEDELSAHLMYARTLVRRSEREVMALHNTRYLIHNTVLQYLNRLSDYFFVLARWVNFKQKIKEKI